MRLLFLLFLSFLTHSVAAQKSLTPELLWQIGRVGAETITKDGQLIYGVNFFDMQANKGERNLFKIPIAGGKAIQLTTGAGTEYGVQELKNGHLLYTYKGQIWEMKKDGTDQVQKTHIEGGFENLRISPKGTHIIFSKHVSLENVYGKDIYPDLPQSNVQVYSHLDYRHWDTWRDGSFQHVFYATYDPVSGAVGTPIDIMQGERFDCPQKPMGGTEDFIFDPTGTKIIYVSKKKYGRAYATSTNTDIYQYDLQTATTTCLSEGMHGYDQAPAFSKDGKYMIWLSMKNDGYEADKNDIILYHLNSGKKQNLTQNWDESVASMYFKADSKSILFLAYTKGTEQLFEVNIATGAITQRTTGQHDINSIVGQSGDYLIVTRSDMNHANEVYKVNLKNGNISPITSVNDAFYSGLAQSKVEERWITTTDNKQMHTWVIYPPNFDPAKKYPTLLYCQGGPQSAVSQFYSFRWNFQLMAAQGYIIVAPNRRGLPGFGVEWNAAISKDWGGQPIKDYLSAIDALSKEPFVDNDRLGAIGASYGGYSIFMLAGVHENRFKTFIAHDGLFDLKSWYGTTEELFFANWDIGNYWDPANAEAYEKFNPSNFVHKWNTPMLIVQGGIDFRVGIEQGLQAFQAAQLQGIKSKLLYFPTENHWVTGGQNAMVWQREFYSWLKETL